MNNHSQVDINNQFVLIECLIENGRVLVVGRLEEIVDKIEVFSMDVVDEVVRKLVEERLVEANAPKEVVAKPAHGDGAAEPLNHYRLLVPESSDQSGLFPVAENCWDPHVEHVFANLERSRDLLLLCVQIVGHAL